MEVQDMKGVLLESWEMDRESPYVGKTMDMKELYQRHCRERKGEDLGHMKNYLMMGLYMAHKTDTGATPEEQQVMDEVLGNRLKNSQGNYDVNNARCLADVTAYLGVTRTKKKGFINLQLRGEEGLKVNAVLGRAFARVGKRQWDSPMARPIQNDVKKGLEEARKKGSRV